MPTSKTAARPRQGVTPERKSDAGPIPAQMLDELRHLLWTMEKLPLYWAIGMGVLQGAVFTAGIIGFALKDAHGAGRSNDAVYGLALAALIAMSYSPFFNWWFEYKLESNWLRQALYPRTLEDLSYYMTISQMRGHKKIVAKLMAIWKKYGLEPGWSARPEDPPPLFR